MQYSRYALLYALILINNACYAFNPGLPNLGATHKMQQKTGGKALPVAWFPMSLRDLDVIGQQTLDAGAALHSEHPGFKVGTARTLRHPLFGAWPCFFSQPRMLFRRTRSIASAEK
jgi:hypothetical protein